MKISKPKRWQLIVSRFNHSQVILLSIMTVLLLLSVMPVAAANSQAGTGSIKLGVPDDLGGLIAHYLKRTSMTSELDVYSLKDCCTTKSEWAMSSGQLNVAIMCPDAAKKLINRDKRFIIAGPCLVNSDVLIVKPGIKARVIGITQNRSYQAKMVRNYMGAGCRPRAMLTVSIPYAYARNDIDGFVIDYIKSSYIQGKKKIVSTDKTQVTYVMVVRKDFAGSRDYKEFISEYNRAVKELRQPGTLRKAIFAYKSKRLSEEDEHWWNRLKIRFISIAQAES